MVRAIMHGCNGRMGQVITGLVREDEGIEIVAGIDAYTGRENAYPVFESIDSCDVEADGSSTFPTQGRRTRCLTTAPAGKCRSCSVRQACPKSSSRRWKKRLRR